MVYPREHQVDTVWADIAKCVEVEVLGLRDEEWSADLPSVGRWKMPEWQITTLTQPKNRNRPPVSHEGRTWRLLSRSLASFIGLMEQQRRLAAKGLVCLKSASRQGEMQQVLRRHCKGLHRLPKWAVPLWRYSYAGPPTWM